MTGTEYVIFRWSDSALTLTGWGLVIALTLLVTYAIYRGAGR